MKQHTSIKSIKKNFTKIFYCHYCSLQDIFTRCEPQYYNSGKYGWNCDIYIDCQNDIAITTGYHNLIGQCIPSVLIAKYSTIAKEILRNPLSKSYEYISQALNENKNNFLAELNEL